MTEFPGYPDPHLSPEPRVRRADRFEAENKRLRKTLEWMAEQDSNAPGVTVRDCIYAARDALQGSEC